MNQQLEITPDRGDRLKEVELIINNACDYLNSEGITPRDYVEQLSWLFFLKAFDELEDSHKEEAFFDDKPYQSFLGNEYEWKHWARDIGQTDQMLEFVDTTLWERLTSKNSGVGLGSGPAAERFRRIFSSVKNHCQRGATFARVVAEIDKLQFSNNTDISILSKIYEDLLKRVASDSAGYAGEFYTPRHIISAMVEVLQPKPGERIYDPCVGSAGFLAGAADFVRKNHKLSTKQLDELHADTFFGSEYKPLAYLLGTMNMILHRIEDANIGLANTLEAHTENLAEQEKYDVILSNPPYGGKMIRQLQTNFRIRSASTECLFLQHIMAMLAKGGRAGVVVPEGVLNKSGALKKVRMDLLTNFNVHTILSLPQGCFQPYTDVKTNVIFFDRPENQVDRGTLATKFVWFYELTNDGFELKTTRKPIKGDQFPDFIEKQKTHVEDNNAWLLPVSTIIERDCDLSAKNPNIYDDHDPRSALEIVKSIKSDEEKVINLLNEIEGLLERET
jgi:type I restriction enzyme M protein